MAHFHRMQQMAYLNASSVKTPPTGDKGDTSHPPGSRLAAPTMHHPPWFAPVPSWCVSRIHKCTHFAPDNKLRRDARSRVRLHRK